MSLTTEVAPVQHRVSEWHAQLELRFGFDAKRTVCTRRRHFGPLTVQKPFYPEGDVCHCYLLHPPGGMAPGDHLSINVSLDPEACVLLTTPAAGKCYRSDGRESSLVQRLQVAEHASLEWLPQENIAFEGCNTQLQTRIDLATSAKFIGWDMACLGRLAAGEQFETGKLRQSFELYRNNQPLLLERSLYSGGGELLTAAWGLNRHSVVATLVATPADTACLQRVRSIVLEKKNGLFAATLIDDALVCRYLGAGAEVARQYLIQVWRCLRPMLLSRNAHMPRIWNT